MNTITVETMSDELVLISIKLVRRLRGLDPAPLLSPAEASALAVIAYAGAVTLGELARYEGVRAPTVTRLAQNLERKGFIRRVSDTADARVSKVVVTAVGRKVFSAGHKRKLKPLIELIGSLTLAERAHLTAALPALRKIANVGG
jgi:DNA-binding MarR family transcriptional regulator